MAKGLTVIGEIGDLYYKTKIHNRFLIESGKKSSKKSKKSSKTVLKKPLKLTSNVGKSIVPKESLISNEEMLHRKLLDIRKNYGDEIRKHGEQTSIKEGFVYLIENASYQGWVKVGMAFDYEKRLRVYNQYDPEQRFAITGLRWVADRRAEESKILLQMEKVASKKSGEWFRIDSDLSLNVFYS